MRSFDVSRVHATKPNVFMPFHVAQVPCQFTGLQRAVPVCCGGCPCCPSRTRDNFASGEQSNRDEPFQRCAPGRTVEDAARIVGGSETREHFPPEQISQNFRCGRRVAQHVDERVIDQKFVGVACRMCLYTSDTRCLYSSRLLHDLRNRSAHRTHRLRNHRAMPTHDQRPRFAFRDAFSSRFFRRLLSFFTRRRALSIMSRFARTMMRCAWILDSSSTFA